MDEFTKMQIEEAAAELFACSDIRRYERMARLFVRHFATADEQALLVEVAVGSERTLAEVWISLALPRLVNTAVGRTVLEHLSERKEATLFWPASLAKSLLAGRDDQEGE